MMSGKLRGIWNKKLRPTIMFQKSSP